MITKFDLFETVYSNNESFPDIMVGDYVICWVFPNNLERRDKYPELNKYLLTKVGVVIKFFQSNHESPFQVEYPEPKDNNIKGFFMKGKTRWFGYEDIIYYSSNKEELESLLNTLPTDEILAARRRDAQTIITNKSAKKFDL